MTTRYIKHTLTALALLLLLGACERPDDGPEAADASSGENAATQTTAAPDTIPASGDLTVYKRPTCGCCVEWIEHIEEAGFSAAAKHPDNLNALKAEHGITAETQSCHTAVSDEGYVFEGHVPAHYMREFLDNPPEGAIGLSVPRMPLGSPGMEMNGEFTPYQVLLMKEDGSTEVYAQVTEQTRRSE